MKAWEGSKTKEDRENQHWERGEGKGEVSQGVGVKLINSQGIKRKNTAKKSSD